MPLAFSSLEITPVKGLLQLADRHILATDQWLTLDNVVLDQAGAVRKRDGYGALPRNVTVGGAAQPGAGPHPIFAQAPATGLWARGNELVALDTDASGTYVDSWSPARATWVRQDEACEVAQTVGVASSLYGIQTYTQTKLIRDYSMARSARVHACLQGDSVASLNKVYVRAVDDATGDVMIADSLAAQLIFRLLRFTPTPGLNEYCGLVSWNIGDTFYAKVDPFTGTIGTPVGFTGPPTSTTIVDATDLGDTRFATATWNPGTTGIDVNLYDTATGAPVFVALATLLLTPGNTVEDVSIHGIAGLGIVVAWREIFAGLDGHIRSVLLSDTTLATVWGPTTVTTGSTVHVSGRSWVSVAVSNAEAAVTWNEGTLPLLLSIDSLAFARIDYASGGVIASGKCANVSALTRPARVGNRWLVGCVSNAYDGALGGSTQKNPPDATCLVLRLDPIVGSPTQLAAITHPNAVPVQYFRFPTTWQPVEVDLRGVVFDSPQAVLLTGPGKIGTRVLSVALDTAAPSPHARQAVASQACLALSGGFTGWYDGTTYAELSFAHRPQLIDVQIGGAGATFPIGTYLYAAVFEWYDDEGNFHQSEPSYLTPADVTVAATNILIQVATLGATNKGDATNSLGRPVQVALFRSLQNGTELFRLLPQQQGLKNDPSVNHLTYTDSTTDAQLLANAYGILYTFGGTLPSQTLAGPPTVATHGGRLWAVDPTDTKTVLFSKGLVSGEAPGFNRALAIRIDDSPSRIEAMASLDDKLVLFTATQVYYVSGDGPGDTGAGPQYQVVRVAADGGCVDPRSVLGYPSGVFYQSGGGLRKIDRALTDGEVGEVRQLFAQTRDPAGDGHTAPIVLASCLDASRRRCRWLTRRTDTVGGVSAPRTVYVVYDYSLNLWTTEEPWKSDRGIRSTDLALASGFWAGQHVQWITAGVVVQGQNTNPGCDDAAWFTSTVRTPWFHAGNVAGYQRATWLSLIGERYGYCSLDWAVFTNYSEVAKQTHRFDLSSTSPVVGRPYLTLELHIAPQRAAAHSFQVSDAPVDGSHLPSYGGVLLSALRVDVGVYPRKTLTSPLNKG